MLIKNLFFSTIIPLIKKPSNFDQSRFYPRIIVKMEEIAILIVATLQGEMMLLTHTHASTLTLTLIISVLDISSFLFIRYVWLSDYVIIYCVTGSTRE